MMFSESKNNRSTKDFGLQELMRLAGKTHQARTTTIQDFVEVWNFYLPEGKYERTGQVRQTTKVCVTNSCTVHVNGTAHCRSIAPRLVGCRFN
uniref:Uncharacterized protein n=1 Tax=Arundo donax TaxID=35708 RepID=A0A0A9DGI9_ARUDO